MSLAGSGLSSPARYPVRDQALLDEIYDNCVQCPSGCLVWMGSTSGDAAPGKRGRGYPRKKFKGQSWAVHRLVCWAAGVPLKPKQQVDHLCTTTLCVRLEHLEPVTHKENQKRRDRRRRKKHGGHEDHR